MPRASLVWAIALLGVVPAILICSMWFVPAIAQDPAYHDFADQRAIWGIPNFWNVVSNGAFLIAAFVAMRRPGRWRSRLAVGAILVAMGSAYYHWSPSSETLVWDRLPMTLVFMSIFAIAIEDRIDARLGELSFIPLLAIGIASVLYWRSTGDLRPYAMVQFYPMLAIPVLLIFRSGRTGMGGMVVLYGFAKVLEGLDHQIGTHPWKHVIAAAALLWLILSDVINSTTIKGESRDEFSSRPVLLPRV